MLKPLKHHFFAEMRPQSSPVFGGGRRRRFCELRIPLLPGKSSLIRLFTSNLDFIGEFDRRTEFIAAQAPRTCMLHGHTCHIFLRLSVVSLASYWIGCKTTCCRSSLSRSRFASIDMRMVHGDLARDSGFERSVGGPAEGVRGRLPLLVLGRSVSSRYVCADILYDRSSMEGRGRECTRLIMRQARMERS